jgi:SAM-dependent MidA family methyltransferase
MNNADSERRDLIDRLRQQIRRHGPISFRDWMQAALYDEREGYYCRSGSIRQGRLGDYRTAAETSSLFGATFARYFAALFTELGSPDRFAIIELGAGKGDFAHAVLSTLKSRYPQVFAVTHYVIDEISPATRAEAAARLVEFEKRVAFQQVATQLSSDKSLLVDGSRAVSSGIVFSNELVDALPVHRVIKRDGELRELCVGLNRDDFMWVMRPMQPRVADYCTRVGLNLAEGQIVEVNLAAEDFMREVAARIEKGFVITVDYGMERSDLWNAEQRPHGTLRGFHRHQLIDDILSRPGEVDITSSIDFTQLKGTGLPVVRDERLDQFLLAEGLLDELETVAGGLPASEALRLRTNARELIMPHGMAASFRVLVQQKQPSD